MNILAVDTSGRSLSLAYCIDSKLIAEFTLQQGYNHSVTQMPMLEQLLSVCDISLSDIDLFTCAVGPGSFTGIRIGVSSVKAMAYATECPAVGVSSLAALIYPLRGISNGLICPAVDARRGRVFAGLWELIGGEPGQVIAAANREAAELASEIKAVAADRKIYFVGDGQDIVMAELELSDRLIGSDGSGRCISAYAVAQIGHEAYVRGTTTDPQSLMPEYFSPSQAERMRSSGK